MSPVHLSEPVTSVLLISGTGSYSARPEGRRKINIFASCTETVFPLSSLSSAKYFRLLFEGL